MPQHPPIELRGSAPIIGSGPIASAPDAGLYPAGVMWWDDVTGKPYGCRYVGNLDGADTIDFGFVLPANGTSGPWELEWWMAIDGIPSYFDTLFSSIVSGTNTRHFRVSLDNVVSKIYADWRNSSGTSFVSRSAINITDGKFRKYLVAVSSDLKGSFFVDGVMQGPYADLSTWSPGTATSFRITGSAASGAKTFTKICNMVVSRNGVVLANVPFSDGYGSIVSDMSGNGYNGTLNDASPITFWKKDWFPL